MSNIWKLCVRTIITVINHTMDTYYSNMLYGYLGYCLKEIFSCSLIFLTDLKELLEVSIALEYFYPNSPFSKCLFCAYISKHLTLF